MIVSASLKMGMSPSPTSHSRRWGFYLWPRSSYETAKDEDNTRAPLCVWNVRQNAYSGSHIYLRLIHVLIPKSLEGKTRVCRGHDPIPHRRIRQFSLTCHPRDSRRSYLPWNQVYDFQALVSTHSDFPPVLVGEDNPAWEGLFDFCSLSAGGSIGMYCANTACPYSHDVSASGCSTNRQRRDRHRH